MSRSRRRPALGGLLVLAVAVVVVLLHGGGSSTSSSSPSRDSSSASPASRSPATVTRAGSTAEVEALLARAHVVAKQPSVPGYDRDCGAGAGCVFGPAWTDDTDAPLSHNGCDTRNDVLDASLTGLRTEAGTHGCKAVGGTLVDPYTGVTMNCATECPRIQIDHVVPLAAAWDLGASSWTASRRARFANDPEELIAVNGSANESKGDGTPASWLPPNVSFRCTYVTRYLRVADDYGLSVTAADVSVIRAVQHKDCG